MKFNHIGYAVKSLSDSMLGFESLGYTASNIYRDSDQNIEIVLLNKEMSPIINQFLEVRHEKQNLNTITNYINDLRSKSGCDLFGIYFTKSKKMVGTLGITNYDKHNKRLEYGLLVGDEKARQFGIGVLASILFYEYIFSMFDIKKIHNPVVDENINA